jgi:hypothetical protein
MIFADYLDKIENTPDEARLIERIAEISDDIFKDIGEDDIGMIGKIPWAGKIILALEFFGECDSIEEFRNSEHYATLAGWDSKIDLDTGAFNLYPGPKARFKIFLVLGISILVIVWLFRRKRR